MSCQSTIFGLIIVKETLIELLIPCHNTFIRVLRKKDFPSQEYKDLIPITISVGMDLRVERFRVKKRLFSPAPSFYLCNSCLITALSVLRYYLKQTSPKVPTLQALEA